MPWPPSSSRANHPRRDRRTGRLCAAAHPARTPHLRRQRPTGKASLAPPSRRGRRSATKRAKRAERVNARPQDPTTDALPGRLNRHARRAKRMQPARWEVGPNTRSAHRPHQACRVTRRQKRAVRRRGATAWLAMYAGHSIPQAVRAAPCRGAGATTPTPAMHRRSRHTRPMAPRPLPRRSPPRATAACVSRSA